MSIINKLPLTRIKITIAKVLYKLIKPFVGKKAFVIKRKGIYYEVDLTEGIDFSLFLFGNFQKHIINSKFINIPEDAFIIDIGANFGIFSLQFAQKFSKGKVVSFEPTHYAIHKFKKNLELNPILKKRIKIVNAFVSYKKIDNPNIKAFSSWKIDGKKIDKHPVHLGTVKSTSGVNSTTLDDFCKEYNIKRIDFIKIDTDGHEYEILKGAQNTISKYRPQIIFEVGIYVMNDKGINFQFYLQYFENFNYQLFDTKTGKKLNRTNYKRLIPALGTTDIIATSC